jgi:hypothetical protein
MNELPDGSPHSLREIFPDAVRYWERRRIFYNLVLLAVVLIWLVSTWPHFQNALHLRSLPPMLVLALAANVCYSTAYLVDLAMQYSFFQAAWLHWRWSLWLAGMLIAILLANYWIADEIYAYVS